MNFDLLVSVLHGRWLQKHCSQVMPEFLDYWSEWRSRRSWLSLLLQCREYYWLPASSKLIAVSCHQLQLFDEQSSSYVLVYLKWSIIEFSMQISRKVSNANLFIPNLFDEISIIDLSFCVFITVFNCSHKFFYLFHQYGQALPEPATSLISQDSFHCVFCDFSVGLVLLNSRRKGKRNQSGFQNQCTAMQKRFQQISPWSIWFLMNLQLKISFFSHVYYLLINLKLIVYFLT